MRLRDHRRFFLQYEGVLSEQRGAVQRIADGECIVEIGEGDVIYDQDCQRAPRRRRFG